MNATAWAAVRKVARTVDRDERTVRRWVSAGLVTVRRLPSRREACGQLLLLVDLDGFPVPAARKRAA